MDLRFVTPDLRAIDDVACEVLACAAWSDERPMRGVAGLVDWRLCGRLSRLARERFADGELGEVLCLQGRPRLGCEKVLVVGAGERAKFDEAVFLTTVDALLRTLEGLRLRRAVVELPGRHSGAIAPERAAELVLARAQKSDWHDAWWLVENAEAQAKIGIRAGDDRRRGRA